jgi:glycosyltransferase involved in cell wall biosynthesis
MVSVLHLDAIGGGRAAGRARRARRQLGFQLWRLGVRSWFRLDRRIRAALIDPAHPASLPSAEATVAIGWRSAEFLRDAPARIGRPFYLIQGYAGDNSPQADRIQAAWRLPSRKMVISSWLEQKVHEICGPEEAVVRIPLGMDLHAFGIRVPPESRAQNTIALLHHPDPTKGTADGLAALEIARQSAPDLRVTLFGVHRPTDRLPDWATFLFAPHDVNAVYNSVAILLHPSHSEGWGLVASEAMSAGCALVAAASEGVSEYAVDGRNALLAPVRDVEAMAAVVLRLIDDRGLRTRIAWQAHADMQAYTWERAVTGLEAALEEWPLERLPAG